MPPKLKFTEGEKVLCFHGPLIYEAKALRSQITKDKQVKYFIHYAGWNKNWDEWVPENRVLKYNEGNVQRQKEVSKQHASGAAKAKKVSTAKMKKPENQTGTDSRASTPSKELARGSGGGGGSSGAAGGSGGGGGGVGGTAAASTSGGSAGGDSITSTPTSTSLNTSATLTTSSRGGRGSKPSATAASSSASVSSSTSASSTSSTPTPTSVSTTLATTSSTAVATIATTTTTATGTGGSVSSTNSTQSTTAIISSTVSTTGIATTTTTVTGTAAATTTTAAAAANQTTVASTSSIESKEDGIKKKRTRIDQPTVETEEQFHAKVEIKIKIPDDLKQWLVDDWDAVNRQQKLLQIPAKTTVQDIINAYISHKKTSKTSNQNKEVAITDVTTSLIEYFDVMLGCQLLYKFERPQYAELLEQYPNKSMSSLYGSFHLLRLFVRLGSMLAFTALDEKSVQLLLVHLQDFLKYLVKNSGQLFSMQLFVNVSSEYHRKIQ